jgi:uncharacterized protein HemX
VGLLALICGLIALAAAVAGAVFLFGRTRELLRTQRAFSRALATATGRLEAELQRLETSGGRAGRVGEDLERSLSQLKLSQARLGVLLAAVGDVRASVTTVTSFLPRK